MSNKPGLPIPDERPDILINSSCIFMWLTGWDQNSGCQAWTLLIGDAPTCLDIFEMDKQDILSLA